VLVAPVVRVSHESDTGRQQLRASGLDVNDKPVRPMEGDPVVVAGLVAGLKLGLSNRGLKGDVPEDRRLGGIRLAGS